MNRKYKKKHNLADIRNRFKKILTDADKVHSGQIKVSLSPINDAMVSKEELSNLLNIEL